MIVLSPGSLTGIAMEPKARASQSGAFPPMPHSCALVPRTPALTITGSLSCESDFEATRYTSSLLLPPSVALTPPPGVTFESGLAELNEKIPGMGRHFDRSTPGMHTTDTVDYCIVVRGEMTLELDDGRIVTLQQGDCVIQNGTRHRWRNPLAEPCLMAFISVGGKPRQPQG